MGDLIGLEDAVKDAESNARSASDNLGNCQAGLARAEENLGAIQREMTRFRQLDSDLHKIGTELRSQAEILAPLQTRIQDLRNNALGIAVSVGSLDGKASTLWVQHTASKLARSVLAIQDEMKTGAKLTGVFVDNPDSMEATLREIAESSVEHSLVDEWI